MQELVSALFGRWENTTALVIGGGPSVIKDLPKLAVYPELVISANEHGMKQDRFKVDLITNVDKIHCRLREPMEKILRPYGIPIVNRHSWADYRLPDWTMAGNTGMQAIALAALLGANPIVVTGIDMSGAIYFHGESPGKGKPTKNLRGAARRRHRESVKPLLHFAAGTNVRPISGPLTEWFPKYNPEEQYKAARYVGYRLRLEEESTLVRVEVVRPFRMSNSDYTTVGQKLAVSPFELHDMAAYVKVLTD